MDIDQMIERLKSEVTETGVAVVELPLDEFKADVRARGGHFNALIGELNPQVTAGAFYFDTSLHPDGDWEGYSQYTIAVDSGAPPRAVYLRILHEYGHHRCRSGGCPCSNPDYFMPIAEAHAHRYVLGRVADQPELRTNYVITLVNEATFFTSRHESDARLLGALDTLTLHRDNKKWGPLTASPQPTEDEKWALEQLKRAVGAPADIIKKHAREYARQCPNRLRTVLDFLQQD
jgi:hypothetical protein